MEQAGTYKDEGQLAVESLKSRFARVREIGNDMNNYPNKLDKRFYLGAEDELSTLYDEILEKYLVIKAKSKEAEAVIMVALDYEYSNGSKQDQKRPTADMFKASTRVETKEIIVAESILEAQVKIAKNYLQTCRNHIAAVTGRDTEDNQIEE